jgi:hypothetical protein
MMSMKTSHNDDPIGRPLGQDNQLARLPDETRALLFGVMENYNILEYLVSNLWWRPVPLADEPGIIAVITLTTGIQAALVNAPVLPRIINDHTLSYVEVMQLFSALGDIPGDAQAEVDGRVITLQLCMLTHVLGSDAAAALDTLQEGLWKMRADLQRAVDIVFGSTETQPQTFPEPHLPRIKVYPKDMDVIYGVLSGCDALAQDIFLYLMEKWDRQGGIITTTGTSICLDMPYGKRQARLAILLPSYGRSQPVIGLFWDSLKRLIGLPPEAIQVYFKAVEKLISLRKTESTAYIAVNEEFTQAKARALLTAMVTLAGTVVKEKVEAEPPSKPRTEPNLDATLKACPLEWAQVYTRLIAGWSEVGGIVQCPRAGRIYLRFKTHPHQSGRMSSQSHQFNILVLAAPKGKHGCQIDIANSPATNLYAAYLDCIPDEVNRFEQIAFALPGFVQEGTVTRIKLGAEFKPGHCQLLMDAISALKTAEEKAV